MEANPKDYLKLAARKHILKIIQDEKLLFSDTIIKINHYNMSQERTIVVTDKAVYNIKKKSTIYIIYYQYNYNIFRFKKKN
jgi:16S rRNA U516 pseudouridylate synthase RsuA-like enzyme